MSELIDKMVGAFCQDAGDNTVDAANYAKEVFEDNTAMLEEIAELYKNGELTKEELEDELADQRDTLETQLLALKVINKAALQKAMDSALNIFKKSTMGL